jgi:hypothetical protein
MAISTITPKKINGIAVGLIANISIYSIANMGINGYVLGLAVLGWF